MFCTKKGKVEFYQLSSCRHCLQKHITHTNYQAYIWRKCLEENPEIPEPEGHGWKLDEGKLVIDWMSDQPASDAVLEFLSCSGTRACVNPTCVCIVNGRRCTDMCRLSTCENIVRNEEENESDSEEEHDSEEESDTDEF